MINPVAARKDLTWPGAPFVARGAARRPLTIAIINNMPDSALRATERQFCRLLSAASHGMLINVRFYTPPVVARSPSMRAHIAEFYDDYAELENSIPDGLIVTGAQPTTWCLEDDPCWDPISRLVDWAVDGSIPAIWSCLASHVATLHLDGINRVALPRKQAGVYRCQLNRNAYQIMHGLPASWSSPHSRLNDLPAKQLVSHGYAILSKSPEVGVDIFCRNQGALQLFFQGHPEYDRGALIGEFRRDIRQFLLGDADTLPRLPDQCFQADKAARLVQLCQQAARMRDPQLLDAFNGILQPDCLDGQWFPVAKRIYMNWLCYLDSRRAGVPEPDIAGKQRRFAHALP
jgi:homoserine O-succinyltransferase